MGIYYGVAYYATLGDNIEDCKVTMVDMKPWGSATVDAYNPGANERRFSEKKDAVSAVKLRKIEIARSVIPPLVVHYELLILDKKERKLKGLCTVDLDATILEIKDKIKKIKSQTNKVEIL